MHTIRLREPWRREVFPEGMRYCRAFNSPTNLERAEVRLVMELLPAGARIMLNEVLAPEDGKGNWRITELLQPRNALVVECFGEVSQELPFEAVRLEIEEAAS